MATNPRYPVIIVDSKWNQDAYGGRVIRAIADRLEQMGHTIYPATTADDGIYLLAANPDLGALLVAWYTDAAGVIRAVRAQSDRVPVFLMAERKTAKEIPVEVIATINGYIWKVEDTPDFIAGRVSYALRRYRLSQIAGGKRVLLFFR